MRVADYILRQLVDYGVTDIFTVTGGGAMHLNDAIKKSGINYICNHHEQASAIAAEGYSRVSGKLGVVCVTSGPGGTNTLTGVLGQWTDSVPVLYLSGQVNQKVTTNLNPGVRQLGDQEIDIVKIVKPITKYAKMITSPDAVEYELKEAIRIAVTGRPGPVWLDIPLDVQSADIPLEEEKIPEVVKMLKEAKRPVIVAGHGIRIAGAKEELVHLVRTLAISVITTFNGFDVVSNYCYGYAGRAGLLGGHLSNELIKESDLILCIGTRNNIRQIGHDWDLYPPTAKKIIVDIDNAELDKKTVKGDLLIQMDAKEFIRRLNDVI